MIVWCLPTRIVPTFQFVLVIRSNLPKEIMELSGFPHKGVGDACYFPAAYVQKYLNDFTDHFNLRQYIKVLL